MLLSSGNGMAETVGPLIAWRYKRLNSATLVLAIAEEFSRYETHHTEVTGRLFVPVITDQIEKLEQ
jgi:hypothetical protein